MVSLIPNSAMTRRGMILMFLKSLDDASDGAGVSVGDDSKTK